MTGTPEIAVNGARLVPDLSGALFWPEKRTLIVADLHLEKGSSYARGRRAILPPYDSAATLSRLEAVVGRLQPRTVVCLGDSFHDGGAAARLDRPERVRLRALTDAYDWLWIAGNHDPAPSADFGGRVEAEAVLGGLLFRHAALSEAERAHGEVSGHYHPKAAVRLRGQRISARCFVGDGQRLMLPAFGAYTGGLNVLDPAIRGLFRGGFRVHLLGARGVYAYAGSALSG